MQRMTGGFRLLLSLGIESREPLTILSEAGSLGTSISWRVFTIDTSIRGVSRRLPLSILRGRRFCMSSKSWTVPIGRGGQLGVLSDIWRAE
ncbi:hypothetical protein Q31b_22420 [Novipirellula aureliae]|uniref:Uncharacterized protein n=1 Tax=Novipirellula aureliae TaxID=2527966 RepID=A0A5C6E3Y8_9BACT|nr:hypothetical protein Q31b_22420 [Novipirellula aureliae]